MKARGRRASLGAKKEEEITMSSPMACKSVLLAAAAGIALASTATMASPPGGFGDRLPDQAKVVKCTHVLGFSQTADWYMSPVGRSTNPNQPPEANAIFESIVDGDRWQLQWAGGAGVNVYANPDAAAWNANILSPCVEESDRPERLVYMISGPYGFDVAAWVMDIETALDNIRDKFPTVKVIALQPVVGAPANEPGDICFTSSGATVRASWQATPILEAIRIVADADLYDDVIVGATTRLRSCNHYVDSLGHIANGMTNSPSGGATAAVDTGLFYRDFDWK